MAGMSLGTTPLLKASLGSTGIQKISLGAVDLWSAFSNMGMDKSSSTFTVPINTSTAIIVTGWDVRSGFPDTQIVSNALNSNGSATVTLKAGAVITGSAPSGHNPTFQVRRNGTEVLMSATVVAGGSIATFPTTTTVTLAPSDKIAMYVTNPSGLYAWTVATGAANTYLYYQ
ncbi:hypothetical protein ACFXG4_23345 [Nocardia sp. NPDC059246]|uniref:hypothetical protein n=1 Tax=unclassified Nocardia TaxID=2637762 RepID=UPI00369EF7C6